MIPPHTKAIPQTRNPSGVPQAPEGFLVVSLFLKGAQLCREHREHHLGVHLCAQPLQCGVCQTYRLPRLCALHRADGLIAVGNSDRADFKMIFYNADGSLGEMCGNGARCICRFAHDQGIAGDTMVFEATAGLVRGWRVDESQYRVALNLPSVLDLHRKDGIAYVELGTPGVPHAVRLWETEEDLFAHKDALREEMRALRFDPAFPKGANVNYCRLTGPGEAQVLTFERGVEDFTLACGTGCGSTACVLWKMGLLPENRLTAQVPGGTLRVWVEGGEQVTRLLLEGPTEITEVLEG
jgi:diaminopimelate epimerase